MAPRRLRQLPNPQDEPTLTAARAAAVATLSVRGLYAAVERGELPAVRVGRRVIIPTARFLAALGLDSQATEPIPMR